jgi:hypothetical protein
MPKAMLTHLFHQLHRLALLVALAVSLTATGFAHQIEAPDQAAAKAFALANGATAADLCGNGTSGDSHADARCLACQIAGTAGLPPASGALSDLDFALLSRGPTPQESRAVARRLNLSYAPQAPPVA